MKYQPDNPTDDSGKIVHALRNDNDCQFQSDNSTEDNNLLSQPPTPNSDKTVVVLETQSDNPNNGIDVKHQSDNPTDNGDKTVLESDNPTDDNDNTVIVAKNESDTLTDKDGNNYVLYYHDLNGTHIIF